MADETKDRTKEKHQLPTARREGFTIKRRKTCPVRPVGTRTLRTKRRRGYSVPCGGKLWVMTGPGAAARAAPPPRQQLGRSGWQLGSPPPASAAGTRAQRPPAQNEAGCPSTPAEIWPKSSPCIPGNTQTRKSNSSPTPKASGARGRDPPPKIHTSNTRSSPLCN